MKIEQGILIPSTLVPVGEGITGASYAIVVIAGLSQRCVVKMATDREIAAECLCALLGNALGLPTLVPVVVTDPRDNKLWFGTCDVGYPSLSSKLQIGPAANAWQMQALARILSPWSQIGHVISFDELVENGDRNPGNILWDGVQFTIIDHERALGLQPKQLNKLALIVLHFFRSELVADVQITSTSAALAQQAVLGVSSNVWQMIVAEFASVPLAVRQHCSVFIASVQAKLASLPSSVINAMSPLFAGQCS